MSDNSTFTIMVVEDDPLLLSLIVRMLESLGYSTLAMPDGEEALTTYATQQHKIDLVLLDMGLPGITGEVVYRRLRQIDENARVVLTSGYSRVESGAAALAGGICGFLHKPYTLSQLENVVAQALSKLTK